MQTYTKTLYNLNGSQAVILPKRWLNKFGTVTEVLFTETETSLTLTVIPNSLTAIKTAKLEAK